MKGGAGPQTPQHSPGARPALQGGGSSPPPQHHPGQDVASVSCDCELGGFQLPSH